ncbi:MAG: hypothetical protein KQH57_16525 [Actinomycetales bacterium]|nr:hypothetical protein [Actinomycetales bacterium]
MPELDDLLVATLDDGGRALAGTRLDDDASAVLRGRISARRARRRVIQSVVAVPAAAALVVGGVVAWQHLGPDPRTPVATQPGPTQPSPQESAPPVGEATPLPDEPGLPSRLALPSGLLERTTPGWVLAVYLPRTAEQLPTQGVIVLAAPDGTTYEVTRLPLESAQTDTSLELVDWRAGSTTAELARHDVAVDTGEETTTLYDVDLLSGAITPVTADAGLQVLSVSDALTVRYDAGSDQLVLDTAQGRATYGPAGLGAVDPSPDGAHLLVNLTVVDTRTGRAVESIEGQRADGWCEPLTWWTADSVLATCTDSDPGQWSGPYLGLHPRLVVLALGADRAEHGTQIRTLAVGDPVLFAWYPAWVDDGEVVLQGTTLAADTSTLGDLCSDGVYLVSAAGITPVPTVQPEGGSSAFLSRVSQGAVYTQAVGGCVYDAPPGVLRSYDPATGAVTVVLGDLAGGYDWRDTRSSWVLGR